MKKYTNFIINFCLSHLVAFSFFRLILELKCEKVIQVDSHMGLLHRGTEKLIEYKMSSKFPYLDQLDYVLMISQEQKKNV